jgi:penicillin-binding protein 2
VQQATEDGFEATGFNGAAVVLDPRNGEVLAFTSRPAYDPNAFACRNRSRHLVGTRTPTTLRPLQNRALQGGTRQVRTFKMAVGSPASRKASSRRISECSAAAGQTFLRPLLQVLGEGGTAASICGTRSRHRATSSSTPSATCSASTGFTNGRRCFGLGVKSGIDLPNELQGLVPSQEWKAQNTKEKKWYAGETISVAIGQGQVSVTPISLAVYTATLANGGTRVTPHLVKAMDDGNELKPVPPPPPQSKVEVTSEKLQAIRDGMWLVVNGDRGTAQESKDRRQGRVRQDRHGAGDSPTRGALPRTRRRTSAITDGLRSSPAR